MRKIVFSLAIVIASVGLAQEKPEQTPAHKCSTEKKECCKKDASVKKETGECKADKKSCCSAKPSGKKACCSTKKK